jgi:hypothetical protein
MQRTIIARHPLAVAERAAASGTTAGTARAPRMVGETVSGGRTPALTISQCSDFTTI